MSFDLVVLIALLFALAIITSGALVVSLVETWTSTHHRLLPLPAKGKHRR